MAYLVRLKKSSEKELDLLPAAVRDRLILRLNAFTDDPRPAGSKKLRGREAYRLRVGDYRILYTIDDAGKTILVFSIAHRRDVYR